MDQTVVSIFRMSASEAFGLIVLNLICFGFALWFANTNRQEAAKGYVRFLSSDILLVLGIALGISVLNLGTMQLFFVKPFLSVGPAWVYVLGLIPFIAQPMMLLIGGAQWLVSNKRKNRIALRKTRTQRRGVS